MIMPSGRSATDIRDPATGLDRVDPVWARLRSEAEKAILAEPSHAARKTPSGAKKPR